MLSGQEVLSNPHQQEVNMEIDLNPGPRMTAGQETPGKPAAAVTLGELATGHKADGNPRTGPVTPGRENDSANPTWLQNFASAT
jgi:hypothetical protein